MEFRYFERVDGSDGVNKILCLLYTGDRNVARIDSIAEILDIDALIIRQALNNNNGFLYAMDIERRVCYFLNYNDLNGFVEEMNPYIIMAKIIQ